MKVSAFLFFASVDNVDVVVDVVVAIIVVIAVVIVVVVVDVFRTEDLKFTLL